MSPSSLHSDSKEDGNCGGVGGNTNEEGVPYQTIAYVLEDPEKPDIFISKRVPSALLSPIP